MSECERSDKRRDRNELIAYWRTLPKHSNEYAAAEIIDELQRELDEWDGMEGRCSRGHNKRFTFELNGNIGCVACERDAALNALAPSATASIPDGWKLVPAVPNGAMLGLIAGEYLEKPLLSRDQAKTLYNAILAQANAIRSLSRDDIKDERKP